MTPLLAAGALGLAIVTLYAVFGGADFGGGVWDLLATGPRRERQREAITGAIGPVWEANHVWLIFAMVLLFTCFPRAYADMATGLFLPLSIGLLGIVLRGAAFVFRNYAEGGALENSLTVIFGASSILAPFFLGDSAGALATGRYAWASPFALSIGLFAVVLSAQVAAVFLVVETKDSDVHGDFRVRAIGATAGVWVAGLISLGLAFVAEPVLFGHFVAPGAVAGIAIAMILGIALMIALLRRAESLARILVAVETAAVLGGWFGAQAPALVPGRFTYIDGAAGNETIVAFLIAAAAGSVLLIPSLWLLFSVFKGGVRNEG